MDDYMVVTRYQKTPESRPITHVYGPYTKAKAKSIKANMRKSFETEGHPGTLEVGAHHPINVEQMNRAAAEREVRALITP